MSRQAKENICDAHSIPVRLHCPFENCLKSYNSKKHINEHFLSTAMDRHVLNSKQHLRPRAVVGYGIKIFGRGLFMTSPDHLVSSEMQWTHGVVIIIIIASSFFGLFCNTRENIHEICLKSPLKFKQKIMLQHKKQKLSTKTFYRVIQLTHHRLNGISANTLVNF